MAMKTDNEEINIGILDIYGFEIFEVTSNCITASKSVLSNNNNFWLVILGFVVSHQRLEAFLRISEFF